METSRNVNKLSLKTNISSPLKIRKLINVIDDISIYELVPKKTSNTLIEMNKENDENAMTDRISNKTIKKRDKCTDKTPVEDLYTKMTEANILYKFCNHLLLNPDEIKTTIREKAIVNNTNSELLNVDGIEIRKQNEHYLVNFEGTYFNIIELNQLKNVRSLLKLKRKQYKKSIGEKSENTIDELITDELIKKKIEKDLKRKKKEAKEFRDEDGGGNSTDLQVIQINKKRKLFNNNKELNGELAEKSDNSNVLINNSQIGKIVNDSIESEAYEEMWLDRFEKSIVHNKEDTINSHETVDFNCNFIEEIPKISKKAKKPKKSAIQKELINSNEIIENEDTVEDSIKETPVKRIKQCKEKKISFDNDNELTCKDINKEVELHSNEIAENKCLKSNVTTKKSKKTNKLSPSISCGKENVVDSNDSNKETCKKTRKYKRTKYNNCVDAVLPEKINLKKITYQQLDDRELELQQANHWIDTFEDKCLEEINENISRISNIYNQRILEGNNVETKYSNAVNQHDLSYTYEKTTVFRDKHNFDLLTNTLFDKDDNADTVAAFSPPSRYNSGVDFGNINATIEWILQPISLADFFQDCWEKGPLHVIRHNRSYYHRLFSAERLNSLIRRNQLWMPEQVELTRFENDTKTTDNCHTLTSCELLNKYKQGYNVCVRAAHLYDESLRVLVVSVEEYFGTEVRCTVHLTPANSRCFAAQSDEMETFILQVEGENHWKTYETPAGDTLPRHPTTPDSPGTLLKHVTVSAGDTLYLPRGTVYAALTTPTHHSLHVTLSTYRRVAYSDLLREVLPLALRAATERDTAYRGGLPVGFQRHLGIVNMQCNSTERKNIVKTIQELMVKLVSFAPLDDAVDNLQKRFIANSLPPIISNDELERMAVGNGDTLVNGKVVRMCKFSRYSEVRLLRYNCLRLIVDHKVGISKVYTNIHNTNQYHQDEEFLEIQLENSSIIDTLLYNYPDYVTINSIPVPSDLTAKISVITQLWQYGLIVTKNRFNVDLDDNLDVILSETEINTKNKFKNK